MQAQHAVPLHDIDLVKEQLLDLAESSLNHLVMRLK